VLGHAHVQRRLWDAAARAHLHHALLFEGPEGVGKATFARLFAQALNCEASRPGDGVAHSPCGRCPTCLTIAAGNHPDVIWVTPDPESASGQISIDAVREVVRKLSFRRYSGRFRVVVVDPVDALPTAAANALLKVLEEPPPDTGFFLLATRADALLSTIRSRCQRIRLGPVPTDALTPWLRARGVDRPHEVARAAAGCPGRAVALAAGELEETRALRDRLVSWLAGDLDALLEGVKGLTEGRKPGAAERAVDLVEELLRDAAMLGAGMDATVLLHPDREAASRRWAQVLYPGGLATMERAIQQARASLAVHVGARLVLESLLTETATELGAARRALSDRPLTPSREQAEDP
jgi:DNA polymerase-3 subunit delta'